MSAAFLFDLDGTLVDSVYQHVRAWHLALRDEGIDLSVWRIHRKIGMSGGLFTNQLLRELGRQVDRRTIDDLRERHGIGATGRSKADAPEIDGEVHLRDAGHLNPGDIVSVRVEDSDEHDLFGVPA